MDRLTVYDPHRMLDEETARQYRVVHLLNFQEWAAKLKTLLLHKTENGPSGVKRLKPVVPADRSEQMLTPVQPAVKNEGNPAKVAGSSSQELMGSLDEKDRAELTTTDVSRPLKVEPVHSPPDPEPPDPGEKATETIENTLADIHMVPLKYTLDSGLRQSESGSQVIRMREFLERMHRIGSFVVVQAGVASRAHPLTHSWLFDTGALVSHISSLAAAKLWSALRPLGLATLRSHSATSTTIVTRQLCMLKGCSLVDPSRGNRSKSVDTHVFINPDLSFHPFIMGMNTMCDFELKFCAKTERVSDTAGQHFRLLSSIRASKWDASYESLASPVKHGSGSSKGTRSANLSASSSGHRKNSGQRRRSRASSRGQPISHAKGSSRELRPKPPVRSGRQEGKAKAKAKATSATPLKKGSKKKKNKPRWYAVTIGHAPGIYRNDPDARQAYEGYPNPVHRRFYSKPAAQQFMEEHCIEDWMQSTESSASDLEWVSYDEETDSWVPERRVAYDEASDQWVPEPSPASRSVNKPSITKKSVSAERQTTLREMWGVPKHTSSKARAGAIPVARDKRADPSVYTPRDKRRVRKARQHTKSWDVEDEALVNRIAKVALASGVASPSSSEASYQPYQRLVKVNDLSDSSVEYLKTVTAAGTTDRAGSYIESEALPALPQEDEQVKVEQVADSSLDSAGAMLMGNRSDEDFSQLVEGLSPISATSYPYPPSRPRSVSVPEKPEDREDQDESLRLYQLTEKLFESPVQTAIVETLTSDPSENVEESVRSAPSKLRFFVSPDGLRVVMSEMQAAIRTASSLGSYMPAAVSDYAAAWLFDSGASILRQLPLRLS